MSKLEIVFRVLLIAFCVLCFVSGFLAGKISAMRQEIKEIKKNSHLADWKAPENKASYECK